LEEGGTKGGKDGRMNKGYARERFKNN